MSVNSKMTAIADEIRAKTGGVGALTLDDMASEVPKVYDAGKKAEYDRFWDDFQQNGNRTDYHYGFAGDGWTAETLNPKYIVRPEDAYQGGIGIFMRCNWRAGKPSTIIDFSLIAHKFDFSRLANVSSLFNSASIDNIIADISNATNCNGAFATGWGTYGLKNITIKVSETTPLHNAFGGGNENISFMEGSIIGQDINLSTPTRLSKASFINVINTLSSTASGKTATFKKSTKEAEFTADEWSALIATKTNWTFSLV